MFIPLVVTMLLLLPAPRSAPAQGEEDLLVYATASGGGSLTLDPTPSGPYVVTQRLPFCPAGICPYSAVDPGFVTPASGAAGRFALAAGTRVSLVIVAIDAAASVKIGATVLRAPGDTALLGSAPDVHVHPEWQVQAPQGVIGEYPVTFRLTTTGAYADSPEYTAVLTNRPAGAPTATATAMPPTSPTATFTATGVPMPSPSATIAAATPTASPDGVATASPTRTPDGPQPTPSRPAPCAGDCNGDGAVTINELVTGVSIALGIAPVDACAVLDRDGDGSVAVAELIQAVNRALNGC